MRRQRWTSRPCCAKSISIKNGKRRSGDCAPKAAGITPGDLSSCRDNTTEGVERGPDRAAEVSRGHSRFDSELKARTIGVVSRIDSNLMSGKRQNDRDQLAFL